MRTRHQWLLFANPVAGGGEGSGGRTEGSGRREWLLSASQSSLLCEPQVSLGSPVFKGKMDESGSMTWFVPGFYRYAHTCTHTRVHTPFPVFNLFVFLDFWLILRQSLQTYCVVELGSAFLMFVSVSQAQGLQAIFIPSCA